MKVTPKSEAEVSNVWPKGIYTGAVEKATESRSKSGNEMIVLEVRIYGDKGDKLVTDYLLDAMAFKVRHFCAAAELLGKYEAGTLTPADCEGVTVRCKVKIEEDEDGQYPPKNAIADYVADKERPEPAGFATNRPRASGGPETPPSDDVPF